MQNINWPLITLGALLYRYMYSINIKPLLTLNSTQAKAWLPYITWITFLFIALLVSVCSYL